MLAGSDFYFIHLYLRLIEIFNLTQHDVFCLFDFKRIL